MHKLKLVIVLLGFPLLFTSCKKIKQETSSVKIPVIWNLTDREKMESFLESDLKHKGSYGMDFRPDIKKAYIQFLYDSKIYEVTVEKINDQEFQLNYNGKSREFIIRNYNGKPFYLNFKDSKPYNPEFEWQRDGNEESGFSNLSSLIKDLEKEYEFSEKEQELQIDASEVFVSSNTM